LLISVFGSSALLGVVKKEERKEKKKRKRERKGEANDELRLASTICERLAQPTPAPSVFIFDVSSPDAVALARSCLMRPLPLGDSLAASRRALSEVEAHEATKHSLPQRQFKLLSAPSMNQIQLIFDLPR